VPPARPVITLLTDFGDRDWFVASMKGVILSIHQEASVVDLSHQIAPHRIEEAAYVLGSCYRHFPAGTIHVAVVDPGVGSGRRPLLVSTARYVFVAPDNGLLSYVLREEREVELRQIENRDYRLVGEGATFDGRDVFAPAAAWLAAGKPFASFGRIIDDPVTFPIAEPTWKGDTLVGTVVYVDRFGNLISNITARHLRELERLIGRSSPTIRIAGCHVVKLVGSYSQGAADRPSALINSDGKLEVFLNQRSAATELSIGVGEEIVLG
jgi:S-adenosylmethionine hydrolase